MGTMLIKQRVFDIDRWAKWFYQPELDAARREHGLTVAGTFVDAYHDHTVIVVLEAETEEAARTYENSQTLADARERCGAAGFPDGVWLGTKPIVNPYLTAGA
ncbi:unnamed protein product [[Actinomadura] parvosata subsp. kistnae]|uniref:Uncharacterized protein n=1 Tax=Nonomuraea composti TaxID=2720023 RepID=A0ABX1BG27_9ACTN|nr:hypothetical protein [Nonomuraea sp. FMUSA5-5]NJP96713.1 hypothetical protein [Nonomuraea sp. FMUSA5-5]SPL88471.1 unnamed protein product [Actinomadura parvosata subsp. kistnae]